MNSRNEAVSNCAHGVPLMPERQARYSGTDISPSVLMPASNKSR